MDRGMTYLIGELGKENEDPLPSTCWASPESGPARVAWRCLAVAREVCPFLSSSYGLFFLSSSISNKDDVLTLISLLLGEEVEDKDGGVRGIKHGGEECCWLVQWKNGK